MDVHSGNNWFVYSADDEGVYIGFEDGAYLWLTDTKFVKKVTPVESLRFLVAHPPIKDGERSDLARRNKQSIVVQLSSENEKTALLNATYRSENLQKLVEIAITSYQDAQCELELLVDQGALMILQKAVENE